LKPEKKNKKRDDFWRACRYLGPHRRLVVISILCAVLVGAAFTGGLGTVLPIMNVLIYKGNIEDWANQKVVESRLAVRLADDSSKVRVVEVKQGSPMSGRLQADQVLALRDAALPEAVLRALADPGISALGVLADGRLVELSLPPLKSYLGLLRTVASKLPRDPLKATAAVLGFLMGLAVLGNMARFFQEYLSEKAAILAVRDIRLHLYDHSLQLHLDYYGQRGTSDITSRLTQDAQNLQDGLKGILGSSIQEPIKAGMALSAALYASWELTLFIVFFAPIMAVLIRKFGKTIRRAARAALQNSSVMLGQIEGSLAGIRVVKAANAERYERRRFRGIIDSLRGHQLRIARMEAFNTPTLELLTLMVVCCIVLGASYMVLVADTLKPEMFFFVMACLIGIGESLRKISKINNMLQKSNAAAGRLFEVIDQPAERLQRPPLIVTRHGGGGAVARPHKLLPAIQREVRFENLTFAYSSANQPAVRNVNLVVPKGMSVAVVGRNGSGKTTLLSLLPRFYDPQEGKILIDDTDVREVTLSSLRKQIGIVTQDSVIFPGTIADNIAYALPQARREEIIAAARRAFAHDFILEKPNGYDTVMGEHGAQLSGGQKQRLCIARAILRQTPILILDEATSQVDAESEHLIQQAIQSLMHERTTFVIAHRFSTILSADLIVVMDRGEIVGSGLHEQLLRSCPTYYQLYERQIPPGGAAPEAPAA
jgi:ABC-type multidrug transport system fused ATPase/permease subunit